MLDMWFVTDLNIIVSQMTVSQAPIIEGTFQDILPLAPIWKVMILCLSVCLSPCLCLCLSFYMYDLTIYMCMLFIISRYLWNLIFKLGTVRD